MPIGLQGGELHECEGDLPQAGYGPAITRCWEEDGEGLWVGNDEYASRVNFCPFCGYEALYPSDYGRCGK